MTVVGLDVQTKYYHRLFFVTDDKVKQRSLLGQNIPRLWVQEWVCSSLGQIHVGAQSEVFLLHEGFTSIRIESSIGLNLSDPEITKDFDVWNKGNQRTLITTSSFSTENSGTIHKVSLYLDVPTMMTPVFNDLLCFLFVCCVEKVSELINHPVVCLIDPLGEHLITCTTHLK